MLHVCLEGESNEVTRHSLTIKFGPEDDRHCIKANAEQSSIKLCLPLTLLCQWTSLQVSITIFKLCFGSYTTSNVPLFVLTVIAFFQKPRLNNELWFNCSHTIHTSYIQSQCSEHFLERWKKQSHISKVSLTVLLCPSFIYSISLVVKPQWMNIDTDVLDGVASNQIFTPHKNSKGQSQSIVFWSVKFNVYRCKLQIENVALRTIRPQY